jgi:protein-L-isoaspartate(D-aspartate) O-methyltransferase
VVLIFISRAWKSRNFYLILQSKIQEMEKIDSFRHKGLRARLVARLAGKGIDQEEVLRAIATVPRHFFLDSGLDKHLYDETKAILIDKSTEQTISQVYTVARQTQLLQLHCADKTLEIGTGTGYQTAILCAMGLKQLFSIERQQDLYCMAKQNLDDLHYYPTLTFGDGFEGLPQYAPFDKIIVTCGAKEIPQKLLQQLSIGGRMVIPLGEEKEQQMCCIKRLSEVDFELKQHGKCYFVPMLQGTKHNHKL